MKIIDIITLKYPNIQGVTVWESQYDGTPWEDPYDGLIWENKDIPKPSKEQLQQWATDVDLLYRQKKAVEARIYPSVGDQLDMIYKDLKNNTKAWVDLIDSIKAAHPKPTE